VVASEAAADVAAAGAAAGKAMIAHAVYLLYLVYWYKGANTDAAGG
jgi:hypothetical protein